MTAELRAKTISPDDAAALVQSGQWIDYTCCLSQPELFDQALARRAAALRDVRIRACMTLTPRAVLEADPCGDHFLWFNWHFSGYDRSCNAEGRCNYIPMNFGEAPDYYRRFLPPIDVICLRTTPMDEHGYFNFGVTSGLPEGGHRARPRRDRRDLRGDAVHLWQRERDPHPRRHPRHRRRPRHRGRARTSRRSARWTRRSRP